MDPIFSELSRNLGLILGSSFVTFLVVILSSNKFCSLLKKFQFEQKITEESSLDNSKTPLFASLHKKKEGTPTMGGVLIWFSILVIVLLSPLLTYFGLTTNSLISRSETFLPLFTFFSVALLGLVDDIMNVKGIGKDKGLKAITKFTWLTLLAGLGAWWFHYKLGYDSITLLSNSIEIGAWYIPLFIFVIVGSANAVNITDGLDGLAAGLTIMAFGALATIAYIQGLFVLSAFCGVIIGGTAAFLWFNIPPAKFFMGDTGSLALGATMGVIAFLTDTVIILPFIAFIFVIETISVMMQMLSKKFRNGKKIFHIAPVHHHFEYLGWPEFRVTMRFWMIGGFMAAFGLIIHLSRLA
jgi:phospho-N-acetylmuramoyl-pentapeptide-transferase